MRHRRSSLVIPFVVSSLAAFAISCGSGDDTGATGTGGGGGAAANDGGGGHAGAGGKAGAGGSGGVAGSGGNGGAAGDGGSGGQAGGDASVDGTAGAAGQGGGDAGIDASVDADGSAGAGGADASVDADAGPACPSGKADCNNDPNDGCETDIQNDTQNCGTCGQVCASGPSSTAGCFYGQCALLCSNGFGDCDSNATNGCETNLATDPNDCGSCGLSCGGGSCIAGACECAGTTQKGKLLPLDMYIMLDESGSMTGTVSGNTTKWAAVKSALSSFLGDPGSAGLGVGIQYFPLLAAGVPATCTSNAQCPGASGPCVLKSCTGLGAIVPCSKSSDCFAYGSPSCAALGQCSNDTSYYCQPTGGTCSGILGSCNPITTSFCANEDSCALADYAKPDVEIAPLPGVANAITASMAAHTPFGNTPTAPALQGAIDHAKAWGTAHPLDKVVVVLATDGLPTECTPTDIPSIAQLAANGASGTPPVLTFAIGVFSSSDITAGAKTNLDQIAKSGGTGQAFIVNTNQNVTQAFLDALNKIRAAAVGCEYALPTPTDGGVLDTTKVNVQWTPSGQTPVVLTNVSDAASCDPTTGGWYYDDPNTPTKIVLCPASCQKAQADLGSQIDIVLGCATKQ